MYFLRKAKRTPEVSLSDHDGNQHRLCVTFKNGEIHINPDLMKKGRYRLKLMQGKEEVFRSFEVA